MRALYLVMLAVTVGQAAAADSPVNFNQDVRPLLAANCYACHGPDAETREADLRLDVRDEAFKEVDGRRAIVPGNREQSEFWKRITSTDPDRLMPPADSGHQLKPAQIALLGRWIDSGAEYTRHWSFEKPVAVALPNVARTDWSRNGIDRFVLHRLEAAGLTPEAEADRGALIRRLSLDLTGLPPTLEQLDAFLNDKSPDAYEKVVDRLLTSDGFGEHWSRMWLDLARYADTKGYEKDQPRNIWRFRDWVMNAFNADLPYDRFTVEQLAGDLLPNPNSEQLLATAFHRNTMTNDEGGTDNEEFRIAAVKDRVDTTLQVWMGLTMGCAKCHSHKYDPIEQREYYSFYDFFNQTEDADRGDDFPRAATPTQQQRDQLQSLDERLATLRRQVEIESSSPEFVAARREWESSIAGRSPWTVLQFESAESAAGARLSTLNDGSLLASGTTPEKDVYTLTANNPRQTVTAIRVEALTHESLGGTGPGRNPADPNFVVNELEVTVVSVDGSTRKLPLANARADFSQNGWGVAGAIDNDLKTGWAVSPQFGKSHVAVFDLAEALPQGAAKKLVVTLSQQYGQKLVLGRVRLSVASSVPEALTPDVNPVADLAAIPAAERSAADQSRLDAAFREVFPATAAVIANIESIEKQRSDLDASIVKTPVMRDLPEARRRETRVHVRGNFLAPGDVVRGAVPAAFHPLPEDAPLNRLGAAQWLMSPENPLTARVAVNRFWARFFGVGIVETEEDFGIQGSLPSHPELLDWLAVQFQSPDKLNWSMKQLCRLIVTSATYRQSSRVAPDKLAADPLNRLLSRAPRFRLPAETIRDQALAVSGLLSSKVGGAPVMPPQPPGIWKATYSNIKWETSTGEDRYRRALYTFWRRTSPYPSMLTFDAGSREVCVIRRIRTNTPLQALVTLNDPVFVEAAGALGRRIQQSGTEDQARIRSAIRRVLSRDATEEEASFLTQFVVATRARFSSDRESASQLTKAASMNVPTEDNLVDAAVWTVVGNALLNLDEFLMRN